MAFPVQSSGERASPVSPAVSPSGGLQGRRVEQLTVASPGARQARYASLYEDVDEAYNDVEPAYRDLHQVYRDVDQVYRKLSVYDRFSQFLKSCVDSFNRAVDSLVKRVLSNRPNNSASMISEDLRRELISAASREVLSAACRAEPCPAAPPPVAPPATARGSSRVASELPTTAPVASEPVRPAPQSIPPPAARPAQQAATVRPIPKPPAGDPYEAAWIASRFRAANSKYLTEIADPELRLKYRLPKGVSDRNVRYTNIIAFEYNRFRLSTGQFIDASTEEGYIRTMGPLQSTQNDFWQMVVESGSDTIVMATPLREGGREKCHQYWPNQEGTYGTIQVKCTAEEEMPTIGMIRTFEVTHNGATRTVRQLHINQWKDHSAFGLAQFDQALAKAEKLHKNGPMIVHCSAGVGRTGTFICGLKMRQGETDIDKLVSDGRCVRIFSVQSESQLKMLYDYQEYRA